MSHELESTSILGKQRCVVNYADAISQVEDIDLFSDKIGWDLINMILSSMRH